MTCSTINLYLRQTHSGSSLVAYRLGFWVFTVMTQVQSLVGELRYHEPKKKRGGEKRTFHSFLSIMYTVQTNRGKVVFHAKENKKTQQS